MYNKDGKTALDVAAMFNQTGNVAITLPWKNKILPMQSRVNWAGMVHPSKPIPMSLLDDKQPEKC